MLKFKEKNLRSEADRDARIVAQDLLNSFSFISDESLRQSVGEAMRGLLKSIWATVDAHDTIRLWVDGSYDPKSGRAGIGVIINLGQKHGDTKRTIAFGKTVKAGASVEAEIYALSVGLSYILDTYHDVKDVHVMYDCVNSTVCATNIDAFAKFGAPYTNFKSALKRARKKKMNIVFEHTKAHEADVHNEQCDLIAKYYARIKISPPQLKIVQNVLDNKIRKERN